MRAKMRDRIAAEKGRPVVKWWSTPHVLLESECLTAEQAEQHALRLRRAGFMAYVESDGEERTA